MTALAYSWAIAGRKDAVLSGWEAIQSFWRARTVAKPVGGGNKSSQKRRRQAKLWTSTSGFPDRDQQCLCQSGMFRVIRQHSVSEKEAMATDITVKLLLPIPRGGFVGQSESITHGGAQQTPNNTFPLGFSGAEMKFRF